MAWHEKQSIPPVCPDDLGKLESQMGMLGCERCGRQFPIVNGIVELLPRESSQKSSAESIQLDCYSASFSRRPDRPWYQHLRSIMSTLGAGYLYSWTSKNVEAIAKGRPLSILDAACGDGILRSHLPARHGYIGMDFSTRPLLRAQRYHPARYYRADLNHIPFPSETFDVVVSLQALQYVSRPEFVLAEIARVLTADGRLLLTVPNEECFKYRWQGIPHIQLQKFNHETIELLLSRNFRVEKLVAQGIWVPLPKIHMHVPGVYGAGLGLSWTVLATPKQ
jgi:SAM-dependent methyltransferase